MKKGIIRTVLDDHRDATMYRHAIKALYFKIRGYYVGKTTKYEDESGCINELFQEVDRLMRKNKELEAITRKCNEQA